MTCNTIEHQDIQVGEMANGLPLTIPVYRIKGQGNGPKVYIQANMHGAEVQGNAVIYQLLEQLKATTLASDITLVPYANPIGCNQKNGEFTLGRFDPITGTNWNRMYLDTTQHIEEFCQEYLDASEEEIKAQFRHFLIQQLDTKLSGPAYRINTGQRIAYNLQRLATEADIVLDLHTGPISAKHLYTPEYAKDSARYFNIANVLLIPNEFDGAMDEACFCPWWSLQQAYKKAGRNIQFDIEAFTVELGSQELIDLTEAKADAASLLSYLNHKSCFIDADFKPAEMTRYACYLKDYLTYYSPLGGMVEYKVAPGEKVEAGQPIANILRMERYLAEQPLNTLTLDQNAIAILHFASASVNQGTELYKFFTDYFEL